MTNDTHFTIKPLTTSIDIMAQRRLLGAWRASGLTDTQMRKMLMLYLGEPAWMDIGKTYPCNNFCAIATGLRFNCKNEFLKTLLRCKGFGFIWKDSAQPHQPANLLAFYTPIWHVEREEDMGDSPNSPGKNSPGEVQYNSLNDNIINIKKKNNKKKNISKYASALRPENLTEQQLQVVTSAARQLISHIATNPDAYAAVVSPINEATLKLMPELLLDTTQRCPATLATTRFINEHLYPYILSHGERLLSIPTLEGQSCWLRNLINCDFMQKKISIAVNDTRRHLAQNHTETLRQCRPRSPHEYEDKASGQRFYDTPMADGSLRQHRIPTGAAPRPSASATWSKFTHKWNP